MYAIMFNFYSVHIAKTLWLQTIMHCLLFIIIKLVSTSIHFIHCRHLISAIDKLCITLYAVNLSLVN